MDGRKIFDAINTCDDVFIKEVVLDMENRRKKQDRFKRLFFNKSFMEEENHAISSFISPAPRQACE